MTGRIKRVLAEVTSSTEGTASFWMIGSRGGLSSSFVGETDYFNQGSHMILIPANLANGQYILSIDQGGSRITTQNFTVIK